MAHDVHLAWGHRQRSSRLVRDTVAAVTGVDPGPVFHSCQRCGSVEHGRPSVDAAVQVSISYAGDVAVIAVCETAPVGVDVESAEALARAGADVGWVRTEARLKAHGVGLTGSPDPGSDTVLDVAAPPGLVAAVAVLVGGAEITVAGGVVSTRSLARARVTAQPPLLGG